MPFSVPLSSSACPPSAVVRQLEEEEERGTETGRQTHRQRRAATETWRSVLNNNNSIHIPKNAPFRRQWRRWSENLMSTYASKQSDSDSIRERKLSRQTLRPKVAFLLSVRRKCKTNRRHKLHSPVCDKSHTEIKNAQRLFTLRTCSSWSESEKHLSYRSYISTEPTETSLISWNCWLLLPDNSEQTRCLEIPSYKTEQYNLFSHEP